MSAINFYIAKIAAEPSPSAAHVDEEVARLNVCVWFSSLPACGAESSAGKHKFVCKSGLCIISHLGFL